VTVRISIDKNLARTFIAWFKDYVEGGADLEHLDDEYEAFCLSFRTAIQAEERRKRRDKILRAAKDVTCQIVGDPHGPTG